MAAFVKTRSGHKSPSAHCSRRGAAPPTALSRVQPRATSCELRACELPGGGTQSQRGCICKNAVRPQVTQCALFPPRGRATHRTLTSAATSYELANCQVAELSLSVAAFVKTRSGHKSPSAHCSRRGAAPPPHSHECSYELANCRVAELSLSVAAFVKTRSGHKAPSAHCSRRGAAPPTALSRVQPRATNLRACELSGGGTQPQRGCVCKNAVRPQRTQCALFPPRGRATTALSRVQPRAASYELANCRVAELSLSVAAFVKTRSGHKAPSAHCSRRGAAPPPHSHECSHEPRAASCELANLRTCELANLRTCELANLRTCELANLRTCELANLRTCELASLRTVGWRNSASAWLRL